MDANVSVPVNDLVCHTASIPSSSIPKCVIPDEEAERLYDRWCNLLPKLVDPLRHYRKATYRTPSTSGHLEMDICQNRTCTKASTRLLCLFWDLSIELLDFYFTLFEQSGDAVTALEAALRTFYAHCGWHMLDVKTEVEQTLDYIIDQVWACVREYSTEQMLPQEECADVLQRRCPACFGGTYYGHAEAEGFNIHVAVDGNFSQCHLRSAGDSPSFYKPEYFIPKEEVNAMGTHIVSQRKKPPNKAYIPKVPDEAVDMCECGHDAADEHKVKTNKDIFDDTGVMALVCKHNIPLFLANIDTPGEQQKYALTLINCLFNILLYNLLPDRITVRLFWSTSIMHAYSHEWSCQLRSKRIWMLDRQAAVIGNELCEDLGDHLKHRLACGVERQSEEAQRELKKCCIAVPVLRQQWELQCEAQMSIQAYAPVRLKKELDVVLGLQSEIDDLERAISAANTNLRKTATSAHSLAILQQLRDSHQKLVSRAEALYTSLNVHDSFPHLEGVDYEFVRVLVLAHDLKINIWKRTITNFLEWDRLNQARTCKTMAKHWPALLAALRKFNKYCDNLQELHMLAWGVPVPSKLPLDLTVLRDDPVLLQDVWIEPCTHAVLPQWLYDANVCIGIHAVLKLDRCVEECWRLGLEANNLCRWFGHELAAVELAVRLPQNAIYVSQLEHHLQIIRLLWQRWENPLVSATVLDHHLSSAVRIALTLAGQSSNAPYHWMPSYHFSDAELSEMGTVIVDEEIVDIPASIADDPASLLLADALEEAVDDDEVTGHAEAMPLGKCMNGCLVLLYSQFVHPEQGNDLAIFSTYLIELIRHDASDEQLWRNVRCLHYWDRGMWIIPLFHPGHHGEISHWTLVVVNWAWRCIFHFDSFADQRIWQDDTQDVMKIIQWLADIALMELRSEGWTCQPLSLTCLQHNAYDCGVWVLASAAAILRRFDGTALPVMHIPALR
ncbi:hypothetical protein NEOLEDRAFT_1158394 [Neolentinus lepideus HHB14362 ss-1]|uniref:Ubiquitin-like protease family profile domain-containing protein n=1 Tax=Neolentinus lepideus HHB14362 ss-1 TaxID=1314782 RepID=A0A165PGD0_9AGAM|nr:hypothetical protein NEOLEDRAFT_1158394 [Neolentinus lepideus HHB14362 ss-1]